MGKVVGRSVGLSCSVYIVLGSFAYLTFKEKLEHSEGNFLHNYKYPDALILLGMIGMSLSVTLAVPLFVNAFRSNIYRLIVGEHAEYSKSSTLVHVSVTVGFILLVLLPSVLVKDISVIFKILGGTTNPMISFCLPMMFFVKSSYYQSRFVERTISIVLSVSICFLSFYSLITNFFW